MARPALSASRTTAILDLLTSFPDRAFKMSEIVQATSINVASCHAVLNALVTGGYLKKTAKRSYVLGPTLIAVGQAASKAHPIIAGAQKAADELFNELKLPVFLTTIVGEEILVLSSISDRAERPIGVRAGQRQPAIAPLGANLVAWSSESVIEAWIAKAGIEDMSLAEEWRRSLALVQQRGYQVTLHENDNHAFTKLMAKVATETNPSEFQSHTLNFLSSHRLRFSQPEVISDNELYDVSVIAAPIFGRNSDVHLSLCLAAFPEKLSGVQITKYADHLIRTCVRVMRDYGTL